MVRYIRKAVSPPPLSENPHDLAATLGPGSHRLATPTPRLLPDNGWLWISHRLSVNAGRRTRPNVQIARIRTVRASTVWNDRSSRQRPEDTNLASKRRSVVRHLKRKNSPLSGASQNCAKHPRDSKSRPDRREYKSTVSAAPLLLLTSRGQRHRPHRNRGNSTLVPDSRHSSEVVAGATSPAGQEG